MLSAGLKRVKMAANGSNGAPNPMPAGRPNSFRYQAFGMQLSTPLALPELMPATADPVTGSDSLVELLEVDHQQWPELQASSHSTASVRLAPWEWRLELEGIGWFRAVGGQRLEWQRWDDSVSDRDIRTFLVTSALGALAMQRGSLVLHGTAIARDGQAVLLLGRPTTGKSTLAWCLQQQGWQVLSSELVAVGAGGCVFPGLQQLKLWHDAAMALRLDWAQLPVVRRGLRRYCLLPPDLAVHQQPAQLRRIYLLNRDKAEPSADDATQQLLSCSGPLSQQRALIFLRNHAFHARNYRGMEIETQLFLQASTLVRSHPVHFLRVPDGVGPMANALADVDLLDPAALQKGVSA